MTKSIKTHYIKLKIYDKENNWIIIIKRLIQKTHNNNYNLIIFFIIFLYINHKKNIKKNNMEEYFNCKQSCPRLELNVLLLLLKFGAS